MWVETHTSYHTISEYVVPQEGGAAPKESRTPIALHFIVYIILYTNL